MNQQKRVQIANDTLELLEQGFYTNTEGAIVNFMAQKQEAINNTKLYTPETLDNILNSLSSANNYNTCYEVANETTLDAVRRLSDNGREKLLCLNFASAKNPGGGFLGGAVAQEECIARASALYPCLMQAPEYYAFHRAQGTCLYSDHMIYSPRVPVLKDEGGNLLPHPVCVSIITSPAVNAGAVHNNEPGAVANIIPAMRIRISKLLALCLHHEYDTLVLGAWGCGVFRNNPEDIASLFHEALHNMFARQFRHIVFAIKTNKAAIIEPFQNLFL